MPSPRPIKPVDDEVRALRKRICTLEKEFNRLDKFVIEQGQTLLDQMNKCLRVHPENGDKKKAGKKA